MGSISGCGARLGFTPDEIQELRDVYNSYREKGLPIKEAHQQMVADLVKKHQEAIMAIEDQLPRRKVEVQDEGNQSERNNNILGTEARGDVVDVIRPDASAEAGKLEDIRGVSGEDKESDQGGSRDSGIDPLADGSRLAEGAGQDQGVRSGEQDKDSIQPRFSLAPPKKSAEFKEWVGDLKAIPTSYWPKAFNRDVANHSAQMGHLGAGVYLSFHGTTHDINTFRTKGGQGADALDSLGNRPVFVSPSPEWAGQYRGINYKDARDTAKRFQQLIDRGASQDEIKEFTQREFGQADNVMPVWVKTENPFQYWKPEHIAQLEELVPSMAKDTPVRSSDRTRKEMIQKGDWYGFNDPVIQDAIKKLGYDGYFENEAPYNNRDIHQPNLAIFDKSAIKSVTGNVGAYGQRPITAEEAARSSMTADQANVAQGKGDIRFSLAPFRDTTPAQQAMLKRVGAIVEPEPMKDRLAKLHSNIGMKLTQGIVDQFAPLKNLSQQAYIQSRMTKGSDGALEAVMLYGNLKLSDGLYDSDAKGKGFTETMQQLQGEQERFMWWVASNRAEKLKGQDRENLFSDPDILEGKKLSDGRMPDGQHRATVYAKTMAEYTKINKSVLDVAEQSGIIDAQSRKVWESDFYVPFYRAMEDGVGGPSEVGGGLVRQYAFKKLKGGTDKLNQDLIGNVLMNWSHLISAAAKNRAAEASLKAAERMGVATKATADAKDSVWYLGRYNKKIAKGVEYTDNGVTKVSDGTHEMEVHGKVHYAVSDPYVMEAITALDYAGSTGPGVEIMSAFKRALTAGVTASPIFKIKNLIRDSVASMAISPLSKNPIKNVAQGSAIMFDKKGQDYASLLASGGIIRFGTMLDGNRSTHLQKLINSGVDKNTIVTSWEHIKDKFQVALDKYNEVGDISEGANRAALYKQMKADGKSHAEAAFAARDLLDFSMGGTMGAVRYLTTVVPFMNARIQGLYKLGKGAKEDPAKFATIVAGVALGSLSLMMQYKDDEDWKKREDFDRDNYWWFKANGTAYRIPKPFEVGAIGTLAERGAELFVNDEMSGKDFANRLGAMVYGTFNFQPVPQMFKPMINLYANKDSFTGRPIEGMDMEKLDRSARHSDKTTEIARFIGGASDSIPLAPSPLQVDHMVKAYFGWLGTSIITAADFGIRPLMNRPERPSRTLKDTFLVGAFAEKLPSASSKYTTLLYDQAKEVESAYATYRQMVAEGDTDGAVKYAAKHEADLATYKTVSQTKKRLSELNSQSKEIGRSSMTPEEKRKYMDEISGYKNTLSHDATDVISKERKRKATPLQNIF